jgi:hypothetical protein
MFLQWQALWRFRYGGEVVGGCDNAMTSAELVVATTGRERGNSRSAKRRSEKEIEAGADYVTLPD